jgi:hypothetical protein
MAAITSSVVGGALMVGGAIKGAKGTKDKTVTQKNTLTKKTNQQKQLEQQSQDAYNQQTQLANDYEQGIGAADAMRDPAIEQYLAQINGSAFQATPEEQQQIQNIRDAMVAQGTQGINQFVSEGLNTATSGAAARGLRGGALGSLRGDVIQNATNQVAGVNNQANLFQAQQQLSQPYSRVQAQQNALQQGLSYGDQMRQNAIANRQQLQSPFLMNQLQQERLATATNKSTTPGEKGGFWGGVTGALTGAQAGLGAGANISGGLRDLGLGGGGSFSQPLQYQGGLGQQGGGYSFNSPIINDPYGFGDR